MKPLARPVSRSIRSVSVFSALFLFTVLLTVAPSVDATATATGTISVTNFTISPASGTVVFGTLWTAQAFAQAQNSTSCCDSQFNSSIGGTAQADASVMFAQGHSLVDASGLTLSAHDAVNITGGVMAANAIGQGTSFNTTFSITGGSGPVDVTFSALLNMTQFLFTDVSGVFAKNDTSYQLSLDGQTVLFMNLSNQIGSNSTLTDSFSGPMSNTITLNFNQTYSVYNSVVDDPGGYNTPEPPAGSLMLLGVAFIAAQRVFVTLRG